MRYYVDLPDLSNRTLTALEMLIEDYLLAEGTVVEVLLLEDDSDD